MCINMCTYSYIYIHIHTYTYRYMHIHAHTCTYMHTHIHTHIHTYTLAYRQTDRQTDRRTDRQRQRQRDREGGRDRDRDIHTYNSAGDFNSIAFWHGLPQLTEPKFDAFYFGMAPCFRLNDVQILEDGCLLLLHCYSGFWKMVVYSYSVKQKKRVVLRIFKAHKSMSTHPGPIPA